MLLKIISSGEFANGQKWQITKYTDTMYYLELLTKAGKLVAVRKAFDLWEILDERNAIEMVGGIDIDEL